MAMRKRYVWHPELLASDIEPQRECLKSNADWQKEHGFRRIRTRMIGKRELLANGVRSQSQVGEYLSKKGNENRRISDKTAYKVCRKR